MSSFHNPTIGLFGGTFDPIHLGHLILAETAFEKLNLDRLVFLPAKISPYKINQPPSASEADRVAMIQLAIKGRDAWSLDARELFRTGPSFTIDTVRELQQEHPRVNFVLLIGEDQLNGLSGWKESEELPKLVSFVVLSRLEKVSTPKKQSLPESATFLDRCIDISSTEIRERLAKNKKVDYLLPQLIHDYIKKNSLYQKID